MEYEAAIGLEIHAELKTRTKMFCACRNDADERHPNVHVCPVCLGHPGTLPVPNGDAIRLVQRVGTALGSTLATFSKFDRKNYFYPDLPKGYQISQYDLPLCEGGYLDFPDGNRVRLTRIHLEEDTGRLSHPEGEDHSVVDFNRAGVPLMELVTEADIQNAEEAAFFAEELQRILRYVKASDANMEKGEMRVEVNLSLQPKGDRAQGKGLSGTKVEIKNLNSIRAARLAVAFEIKRQTKLLREGKTVVQETRGWNEAKQETFSQRAKEEAHDYRYFPEPDIPPLHFTENDLTAVQAELPELPAARRKRFPEEYGVTAEETEIFVNEKALGDYFERVISELREGLSSSGVEREEAQALRLAVNYLLSDLQGLLVEHATTAEETVISPENFAQLIALLTQKKITSRVGKDVLRLMFSTGRDPQEVIEEQGLMQTSDEGEISQLVVQIITENPKPVEDFKSGKEAALQFLVGKVMAATKGKVNPEIARELLKKAIG